MSLTQTIMARVRCCAGPALDDGRVGRWYLQFVDTRRRWKRIACASTYRSPDDRLQKAGGDIWAICRFQKHDAGSAWKSVLHGSTPNNTPSNGLHTLMGGGIWWGQWS